MPEEKKKRWWSLTMKSSKTICCIAPIASEVHWNTSNKSWLIDWDLTAF